VPTSILSWDTGCSDLVYLGVQAIAGMVPSLGHYHFILNPLKFISDPTIQRCEVSVLKALLNNPQKRKDRLKQLKESRNYKISPEFLIG
jgi:hypothetical protein